MTVDAPPVGESGVSVQPYPVAYPAVNAMTAGSWDETTRETALENLLWGFNYALPHLELTPTVPKVYHDTADWIVRGSDALT